MAITRPACNLRLAAVALVLLAACASRHHTDDFAISTQVKIALLADLRLGAQRLDVSTLDGIVTLSGTVATEADADRARAIARHVAGVRGVTSVLKIVQSPEPAQSVARVGAERRSPAEND